MIEYQRLSECAVKHSTRSKAFLGALGWILRGLLTALALVVGIGAWTPPALAASFGWAYLWAHSPASSSYTPSLPYQFNSSGATNTVVRTDVGAYTALLPNLGADAGIVHVTAHGAGTEVCKVVSWYPSGSTQQVHVQCFTSIGTPVDTCFTLTYAHPWISVQPIAFLWANQPSSLLYTPSLPYQFNSSGATNTVVRTDVGAYTALLPNLGADAGIVHVTAYGAGTEVCKVASWYPSGSTQQVHVQCFTSIGTPADTCFTLTYAHPWSSVQPIAFLWANQPTLPAYTPSLPYQFNDTGATNTVVQTGVGVYTALLPNLGAAAGIVHVTAYGAGTEVCKVVSWYTNGSTQQVCVQCFTSAGAPVDTRFTMTYVSHIGLVGSACDYEPGTCSAYAWATQPTSPAYTPSLPYQFNDTRATNMITRLGIGVYWVQLPYQSLDRGDIQVTAYGAGSAYCKVAYWTPWAGVQVRCFSSAGVPVDTYFDVTFLASYLLG